MSFMESLLLGFIQGLTEFLPISSSGHLKIAENILGLSSSLKLALLLHGATTLSILACFYKDILKFLKKPRNFNYKILFSLSLALLPLLISGYPLKGLIESLSQEQDLWITKIGFLLTGVLLISLRALPLKFAKNLEDISLTQAFLIGVVQCFCVLPGFSRSGWTIATALLCGLKPKAAFSFSFLIGFPAILGPLVLTLMEEDFRFLLESGQFIGAFLTAFLVGVGSLFLILKMLEKSTFYLFGIYLIPLALYLICF